MANTNSNEQTNGESGLQDELNRLKQASSYFVNNGFLGDNSDDGDDKCLQRVEQEKRQLKFNYFQDWKMLAMEANHHPDSNGGDCDDVEIYP